MSLLSDIASDSRRPGGICTVRTALAVLSPEDAADLVTAIANHALPASAIARAVAKRNVELRAYSIARHRRGDCACP